MGGKPWIKNDDGRGMLRKVGRKGNLSNRASTQFLCLTVSVFLRMALFLFEVSVDLDETLNGRLPLEDNSDFDDYWTELIVMI